MVPTLLKYENVADVIEASAMVASRGKEEEVITSKEDMVAEVGDLNAYIVREQVIPKKTIIPCMVFQTKLLVSNLKIQNLKFLTKSTKNFLGTSLGNQSILVNPL